MCRKIPWKKQENFMTSKINIREAGKTDIPILAQHNQALANETENIELNTETILSGVSKALDREDCHYFVAEFNGEVAGQIMITYEWSDWRNGVMWWIQSVYVRPKYRNKGVFRALFTHIEQLARNRADVKALRLYVMQDNQSGKNTYKALGMRDSRYIIYEKKDLD
jgi:GNAT superfamily N-acetyltransferase